MPEFEELSCDVVAVSADSRGKACSFVSDPLALQPSWPKRPPSALVCDRGQGQTASSVLGLPAPSDEVLLPTGLLHVVCSHGQPSSASTSHSGYASASQEVSF